MACAPDQRTQAPDPGRGPRARAPVGDECLRPCPSALGTHPGGRRQGREGGTHRQAPPFPARWRGRDAHTIGASLNTTLMSYSGTCDIGINIDTAAVPDPDVLVAC